MELEGYELDEALMDDLFMMSYLKAALESGDVARVMDTAQRVVRARDHREVTIRELAQWDGEKG